jgi:hypothetical protein
VTTFRHEREAVTVNDRDELAGQVRGILDDRHLSETEKLRRIRALVTPPGGVRPVELTERGWPVLKPGSGVIPLPDSDDPYDPRD